MPTHLLLFTGSPPQPEIAPIPRSPLPPFPRCDSCTTPDDYWQDLPWEPPQDRDFLRADCWGVELDGLPFVPGGSTNYPSCNRVASWFLDRWDMDWQKRILE